MYQCEKLTSETSVYLLGRD